MILLFRYSNDIIIYEDASKYRKVEIHMKQQVQNKQSAQKNIKTIIYDLR